jgi:hypothetical protein
MGKWERGKKRKKERPVELIGGGEFGREASQ